MLPLFVPMLLDEHCNYSLLCRQKGRLKSTALVVSCLILSDLIEPFLSVTFGSCRHCVVPLTSWTTTMYVTSVVAAVALSLLVSVSSGSRDGSGLSMTSRDRPTSGSMVTMWLGVTRWLPQVSSRCFGDVMLRRFDFGSMMSRDTSTSGSRDRPTSGSMAPMW